MSIVQTPSTRRFTRIRTHIYLLLPDLAAEETLQFATNCEAEMQSNPMPQNILADVHVEIRADRCK